jgi:hypothetical protein
VSLIAKEIVSGSVCSLWGGMLSCAPIGNRRKLGRLTVGQQVAHVPTPLIPMVTALFVQCCIHCGSAEPSQPPPP